MLKPGEFSVYCPRLESGHRAVLVRTVPWPKVQRWDRHVFCTQGCRHRQAFLAGAGE